MPRMLPSMGPMKSGECSMFDPAGAAAGWCCDHQVPGVDALLTPAWKSVPQQEPYRSVQQNDATECPSIDSPSSLRHWLDQINYVLAVTSLSDSGLSF